jgi:hypothetical protein
MIISLAYFCQFLNFIQFNLLLLDVCRGNLRNEFELLFSSFCPGPEKKIKDNIKAENKVFCFFHS